MGLAPLFTVYIPLCTVLKTEQIFHPVIFYLNHFFTLYQYHLYEKRELDLEFLNNQLIVQLIIIINIRLFPFKWFFFFIFETSKKDNKKNSMIFIRIIKHRTLVHHNELNARKELLNDFLNSRMFLIKMCSFVVIV